MEDNVPESIFVAKREYPKRLELHPLQKNREKWEAYFEKQYREECERLHIPITEILL